MKCTCISVPKLSTEIVKIIKHIKRLLKKKKKKTLSLLLTQLLYQACTRKDGPESVSQGLISAQ